MGWVVDPAWRQQDVETMTRLSPLIEVEIGGTAGSDGGEKAAIAASG